MAIPTLLRQTDYTGVDFTDKAQGTFEVLKDALVDKFGWTLLFEDLASPNKSFVVANTGSQSCLKITKEDGDTSYLKFEAAQSYSDINTPVNAIQSCYYYFGYAENFFYLVGDTKRFYFVEYSNELITESSYSTSFFCGDINPFIENDPDVFVLTANTRGSTQFDTGRSESDRGTIADPSTRAYIVGGRFGGGDLYNDNGLRKVILAPGSIDVYPKISNIQAETPLITSEAYIVSAERNENEELVFFGKIPGLNYCVTPSERILSKNRGELILLNGIQAITIPCTLSYYNKGVILLNDWDVL